MFLLCARASQTLFPELDVNILVFFLDEINSERLSNLSKAAGKDLGLGSLKTLYPRLTAALQWEVAKDWLRGPAGVYLRFC